MNQLINSNNLTMSSREIIEFIKTDEARSYENLPKPTQVLLVKGMQMTIMEMGIEIAEECEFSIDCMKQFKSKLINSKVNDYVLGYVANCVVSSAKSKQEEGSSESYYHRELVLNFEKYLPEYSLLSSEMKISKNDTDRIDLYARCKETHKDVIIELKVGAKSAHKQLRSYAWEFDEPILVNISEKEVKVKREGIRYLTFKDIGLYAQSQIEEIK